METVVQLISTVGFPIVAYFGMFKYVQSLNDAHKEETKALRECIDAIRESVDSNTDALNMLKERMEK